MIPLICVSQTISIGNLNILSYLHCQNGILVDEHNYTTFLKAPKKTKGGIIMVHLQEYHSDSGSDRGEYETTQG